MPDSITPTRVEEGSQEEGLLVQALLDKLDSESDDGPAKPKDAEKAEESEEASEETAEPAEETTEPSEEPETSEEVEEAPVVESKEPPPSWSKEESAVWAKVPPAAQEVILHREQQRTTELRRQQNETAELRKTVESKIAAFNSVRDGVIARLQELETLTASVIHEEFQGIDWDKLADSDPGQCVSLQMKLNKKNAKLNRIISEKNAAVAAAQAEAKSAHSDTLKKEGDLLQEKLPEFSDAPKRDKLISGIKTYAKSLGYTETEIDNISDHRIILVLKDAAEAASLRGARAQTAKKLVAAPAKPTLRATAAAAPGSSDQRRVVELRKGLAKSNRTDDQAAILAAIFDRTGV